MKKLKNLNLNNASLMNEAEMKMVTGGYSEIIQCSPSGSSCSGSCSYLRNSVTVLGTCSWQKIGNFGTLCTCVIN